MNIRSILSRLFPLTLFAAMTIGAVPYIGSADVSQSYLRGDINTDGEVNTVDLSIMGLYLSGKANISRQGFSNADLDGDNIVDSLDLILLRKELIKQKEQRSAPQVDVTSAAYYTTTVPSTYLVPAATVTTSVTSNSYYDWLAFSATSSKEIYSPIASSYTSASLTDGFIQAPLSDMQGSLTSQSSGRVCIFYVDFPDCQYSWEPSMDMINEIAFSDENENSENYPLESINAFFKRSSKHRVNISGQAFRYTAAHIKAYYEIKDRKHDFVNEILDAMDEYVDFNSFDANGDKVIDAMIISVPSEAGEEEWWPCTSSYGYKYDKLLDGLTPGHIVIGNAEIKSSTDYKDFASSYVHELGHCMGLPDYYLYHNRDSEGLHGSAGFDIMDELFSDFSCASKLMLGWYNSHQIEVYDGSQEQTFTLHNAQTEEGNCVIIPRGKLKDNFRSEFLIVEYMSLDRNNSDIPKHYWWRFYGSGVRVFHVEATDDNNPSGRNFLYRSGNNEATNFDLGKRFIRVVNDSNFDNLFRTGDVISHDDYGFGFYDVFGLEEVDPMVEIEVGELTDDAYTITIRRKAL